ncbi:MAG: hypothetical protein ABSB67_16400 [Bryobacteraceae bacterium]
MLLGVAALAFAEPKDSGKQDLTDRRVPVWSTPVGSDTRALAFSPDDKYLALASFNGHPVVVDVQAPKTNIRSLDLAGGCGIDLAWNESSDVILVCGALVRLGDGTTCRVSYGVSNAFWLDSQHIVRSTGEILDLSCRVVGQWCLQPGWSIAGVAASKGWVLLERVEGQAPALTCQYSIIDRDSHRTLTGWPTRKAPCGGSEMLAAGAEALCFDLDDGFVDNERLDCRAISGGKEIHIPRQVRGFELNQAAAFSPRVVADKWRHDREPLWAELLTWWLWPSIEEGFPLPRQRVVFDIRSGKLIASWKPRVQHSTSPYVQDWPYRCALSSKGELLAESGDGTLELYRFAP